MNKQIKMAILIAGAISIVEANNITSHSFFSVRPLFQNGSPEKTSFFRDDMMSKREEGWGGAFQAVILGSRTTNSNGLAKYFTPFDKVCLNVVEFKNQVATPDSNLDPLRDLEARNFNIETVNANDGTTVDNSFRSTICFCPRQDVVGAGFNWKQAICRNDEGWAKWWFEISFPVFRVRNSMGLTEVVENDGGGVVATPGLDGAPHVANMIEAFQQESWQFGRIVANRCLEKTRVGDIEVKLGWLNMRNDDCHWDTYVGAIFPAGNKPNAKFVFEPIVGNNRHFGLMYGSCIGLGVWECRDHKIDMEFNMNGRYLFRNTQIRSFDLKDKSWSRYLEMYESQEAALAAANAFDTDSGTSGINLMTKCVYVSPRFQADFNSAFVYTHCNWMIEAGYNFWGRHAEQVCLKEPWVEGPAVKDIGGNGATNIARTIQNNFPDSFIAVADYRPILQKDLDLESAAHPCVITNTVYGTVGYNWDCGCYPTFAALGASYEFTHGNTDLNRWVLWGKLALSY